MKKRCKNCWIGKSFKKHGVMTEYQFKICYFQCNFNQDGGDWEKEGVDSLTKIIEISDMVKGRTKWPKI